MPKKYDIIVIDPPWKVSNITSSKCKIKDAEHYYERMQLDDIKTLNIKSMCKPDAKVFLWVTNKILEDSFDILKGWGFKYYITMAWNKKKGLCLGGFHWCTEYVVMGYCGRIESFPKTRTIKTNFTELSKGHSIKPGVFYDMVGSLPGDKADIFARNKREGWDVFGNEIDGRDIRDVIKEYD